MRLRRLEIEDAGRMLEWMHDADVVADMNTDFQSKTLQDCISFIRSSWKNIDENLHLAVADDKNVYQGTVSLKHIDPEEQDAEFAIIMHSNAIGKGTAILAMQEMLKRGREGLKLKKIYWCVGKDNIRALRFYDKNEFRRTNSVPWRLSVLYQKAAERKLIWYQWNDTPICN